MITKIILNVPYHDKDQVKQLGAKWDPKQKVWYIPPGKNSKVFNDWLPKPAAKPVLLLNEIALLRNMISCWSCKGYCTVYALCARSLKIIELPKITKKANKSIKTKSAKTQDSELIYDYSKIDTTQHGFFILSEISELPEELSEFIAPRCRNFRHGKVNEHGFRFYRNHCEHCAIGFSDARLHKKSSAFNPTKLSGVKSMQCIDLQFLLDCQVKADYNDYSDNKFYLENLLQEDYLIDYM